VEDHPRLAAAQELLVHLSGLAEDGEAWPLNLTNDIDLVALYRTITSGGEESNA
jgi:hypothetical protein